MLLVVLFICIEHSIEPGQQFLCTMVRVHDDGDSVDRSNSSNIMSCSNCSCYRGFLLLSRVLEPFTTEKGGAALRDLQDDRGLGVSVCAWASMWVRCVEANVRVEVAICDRQHCVERGAWAA